MQNVHMCLTVADSPVDKRKPPPARAGADTVDLGLGGALSGSGDATSTTLPVGRRYARHALPHES